MNFPIKIAKKTKCQQIQVPLLYLKGKVVDHNNLSNRLTTRKNNLTF